MEKILTWKRHPWAFSVYAVYLILWGLFTYSSFRILNSFQDGQLNCMTGIVAGFVLMLGVSGFYLLGTLFFALFNSQKRFYLYLAVAILLPPLLVYTFQMVWK